MRAVTIIDKTLAVANRPDLIPSRGELLVGVKAAGVNAADLLQLKGHYAAPAGSPADIPGLEFAGEVISRGEDAQRFEIGARVMGIAGGGGQATQVVVHERMLMPIPEALEWPSAGGFPEAFATAYDALFTQANLLPGDRLLVHGGAGGVGTAAIQLAVSAGASVVATVRSPSLHASVASFGADVVDPSSFELRGPYDVILELVGAPNMAANIDALAPGGRIVVIGVGNGFKCEMNLLKIMNKRANIGGSTLRSRPLEEKAQLCRQVEAHVLPALSGGRLRVPIEMTYSLEDAAEAYERFSRGGKLGKIVLTISG